MLLEKVKYFAYSLTVCFCFLTTFTVSGQHLYYDVIKGDKTVGQLEVTKTTEANETVVYRIQSTVSMKVLFTFRVNFTSQETFTNGRLTSGDAISELNGRTQKDSHVKIRGEGVEVKLNGSDYDYSEKPVTYSVPMLYFEEPGDRQMIFSQQFAAYIPLKTSGDSYILDSPDGNNYYTYKNGICQEVKVSRDFATFYFRLKEVK